MRLARNGVHRVREPSDLSISARLVIALMNMGVKDDEAIRHFFVVPNAGDSAWARNRRDKALRFIRRVKDSQNPVVQEAIQDGLEGYVDLPYASMGHKVWCGSCRQHITVLPCPLCSLKHPVGPAPEVKHKEPPIPANPTKALPGSLQKVLVMMTRYERGEQIFHPKDRICES